MGQTAGVCKILNMVNIHYMYYYSVLQNVRHSGETELYRFERNHYAMAIPGRWIQDICNAKELK